MFKVPGFNIPAGSLKTQTETSFGSKKPHSAKDDLKQANKKKRKRQDAHESEAVTTKNVADLFHKHVETANVEPRTGLSSDKTEDASAPKKRKTLKEKKREKRALAVANGPTPTDLPTEAKPGPADAAQTTQQNGEASRSEPRLTALQSSMQQKLISSRFRHLNQTLYTTPSEASMALFKANPEFFSEYHEGFQRQVAAWPQNPVEGFIEWIKVRGALQTQSNHRHGNSNKHSTKPPAQSTSHDEGSAASTATQLTPLPRDRKGICSIADLGCGDGRLAQALHDPPHPSIAKNLRLNVRSFDLASNSKHVEVADISALPLSTGSIDTAIFSLALMGTNWIAFVEEAYRVLRWHGECWVSEVSSRFAPLGVDKGKKKKVDTTKKGLDPGRGKVRKNEGEDLEAEDYTKIEDTEVPKQKSTDVSAFVAVLRRRGLELLGEPELDNKMFVRMRFVKSLRPAVGKDANGQSLAEPPWKAKKKFIQKEEEIDVTDEAKVLKPCVYKQR